jgi:hypothetical protein
MSDSKFIKFQHEILDTDAWIFVSRSGAVSVLLEIWRRHNGRNNGRIAYSQREAMRKFRCSPKRVVRWFCDLQEAGFLVVVQRGSFSQKTGAPGDRATTWRLTMEPCEGAPATRDYLNFTAREV